MTDSITFNSDGTVFSQDGQVLNRAVRPNNVVHDSQRANIGIGTAARTSVVDTYQQATGAQSAPLITSVQLHQPTGLVKIAGMHTTPEVLEKMKVTSPELFVSEGEGLNKTLVPRAPGDEAEEAAAAKAEADNAKAIVAKREEINRFVDDAAEGAAMHISSDVELGDQVRLLHELHTTGNVSERTLNRVADQLHLSVADTVDALNQVSMNVSLQMKALCNARGVQDAEAFSKWFKASDSNGFFKAVQIHTQERDMVRAREGPLARWIARGQR
jgi:hypothetical protein